MDQQLIVCYLKHILQGESVSLPCYRQPALRKCETVVVPPGVNPMTMFTVGKRTLNMSRVFPAVGGERGGQNRPSSTASMVVQHSGEAASR
jgi:hypothetical protein